MLLEIHVRSSIRDQSGGRLPRQHAGIWALITTLFTLLSLEQKEIQLKDLRHVNSMLVYPYTSYKD
jgi:hypothetical protein